MQELDGPLNAFLIMPRYGYNLEQLAENCGNKFSRETILDLGQRLVKLFEVIHGAGFVYNDLKLDNIMIGLNDKFRPAAGESSLKDCTIHLIDFGYCTKFLSKGNHISQEVLEIFRGNMMFCSIHQMNFKTTSRRDDLISLCYLLSYLLNGG